MSRSELERDEETPLKQNENINFIYKAFSIINVRILLSLEPSV